MSEAIDNALFTIVKTTDQVSYVLEHFPEARKNEGLLVEKVLQYWPIWNARCIYDVATKNVELVAPYETFIYLMKHVSTITRVSRAIRAKHPEWADGTSHVDDDRTEEEAFSKAYWIGLPAQEGL